MLLARWFAGAPTHGGRPRLKYSSAFFNIVMSTGDAQAPSFLEQIVDVLATVADEFVAVGQLIPQGSPEEIVGALVPTLPEHVDDLPVPQDTELI